MKSVKLKRVLIFAITLLMVMSAIALIPLCRVSGENAFAADPAAETSNLRLVLSCDVEELETLESDQTFTLTARLEGVASVENGVYCVAVRITPLAADELEFVGFTPSRDFEKGVYTSELMKTSRHKEGEYVSMEVSCDMRHAITEDIEVGSFTFKLKNDPLKPAVLKFAYKANVTEFAPDYTFPTIHIEETTYELSITGISLGAIIGIAAGILAAVIIVVAVILIVDHKKKKDAKKAKGAAENEAGNVSVADAQKDDSVQEADHSDNNASESDVNTAINDGYGDNAAESDPYLQEDSNAFEPNVNIAESEVGDESTADLQEDSSAQEVVYSDNSAPESDDNAETNYGYNDSDIDTYLKEDNSKQE